MPKCKLSIGMTHTRNAPKQNQLDGMTHTRTASFSTTLGGDDNTLTFVIVSDDNGGMRYDWSSGVQYIEVLEVDGANTSQLNVFFKDHIRSVDNAIGKVINVRVEDNMLLCDVTFGSDSDSQRVKQKYIEGILTDVSIGYNIQEYRVEEVDGAPDIVTVTKYDVFELSAIGVGFDSKAKKREDNIMKMTEQDHIRLAELLSKGVTRTADETAELQALQTRAASEEGGTPAGTPTSSTPTTPASPAPPVPSAREQTPHLDTAIQQRIASLEAQNAELQRSAEIRDVAQARGVSDELTATFLADQKRTVADFNVAILDEIEARSQAGGDGVRVFGTITPAGLNAKPDIADALVMRFGGEVEKPSDLSMKLSRASLTDMAGLMLGISNTWDRVEIAERSMLSGEFPLLLGGAGNRTLVQEFDKQPNNYKQWVKEVDLPDFRIATDIIKGRGGRLEKVGENGDLKEQKQAEASESWNLSTYGKSISLTREMIVNDDLGAFTDLVTDLSETSATTVNGLVYDMLRGKDGYKMADGSGLYIASRNNKSNVDFSAEALENAIVAMGNHVGLDGKKKLAIKPTYLHVSNSDYFKALTILNSTASLTDNKNSGNVNVLMNIVTPIVDAELEAGEWFLTADRRTLKVGYLAGTGRRPIIKMNDMNIMKTVFDGVFDIGVMAEDYRGLYAGKMA